MNPLLPALSLTACYALAVSGWLLAKRPPEGLRRLEVERTQRRERTSLVGKLIDVLSGRLAGRALEALRPQRVVFLRHRLDAAGRPMTLEAYVGRKAAYTVLYGGAGLFLLVLTGAWYMLPALAYYGWVTPDLNLARLAKRRQAQIDRDLPDFLDVLAVIVAAGSGFRAGLTRVAGEMEGPLAEEVVRTLRQMELGASRRAAFEALRDRNDSEPLALFVASLLQAEELGAPLTNVLGDIAMDMRREFEQIARRRAAQATPRVGVIVTTVVMPGAIVLIVGGLVVSSGVLGGFGG